MRIRPMFLAGLALVLLGATAPSGCTIPWQALLDGLTSTGSVLNVRVINNAYEIVQFTLTTGAATGATTTAPSTQTGGTSLAKDTEYDTTYPCTTLPDVLACKATLESASGSTAQTATSETLHKGTDYSCGSTVTFTVRQAARVGIVVGASAN
jgi:hypothetical protein